MPLAETMFPGSAMPIEQFAARGVFDSLRFTPIEGGSIDVARRAFQERTGHTPSIDFSTLPIDGNRNSLLAIATALSTADLYVARNSSGQRPFTPLIDYPLRSHIQGLKDHAPRHTMEEGAISFLSQAAACIEHTLTHPARYRADQALALCLSPTTKAHEHSFGIFEALFPHFSSILAYPIGEKERAQLADAIPRVRTVSCRSALRHITDKKAAGHTASEESQPIETIGDIIVAALRESRTSLDPDQMPLTLAMLFREALTIRRIFAPNENQFDLNHPQGLSLLFELTVMGKQSWKLKPTDIAEQMRAAEREAFERRGSKPIPADVEALLRTKEPLVHPADFGLTIHWPLTHLIRRIPNQHLDPEDKTPPQERERDWRRIFVVLPEAIRADPEGFYQYQRALVQEIARHIGIPLDPGIPVPLPKLQNRESEAVFRDQEGILKNLSDWHYLLLYPDVQRLFFEMLPFCGLPPVSSYEAFGKDAQSLRSSQKQQLAFAWETPENRDGIRWRHIATVNQLPFLNSWDAGKLRMTIPTRFIRAVHDAGGVAFLDHGIARAVLLGAPWQINTQGYTVFTDKEAHTPPAVDVDMLVLGDVDLDLGHLAVRVSQMLSSRKGVFGAIRQGRSMRGVQYAYISKNQRMVPISTDRTQDEHPMTMLHALRAWMGRDIRQPTELLPIALLPLATNRSFGLLPVLHKIHGSWACLVKPVDIYHGLVDHILGLPIEGKRRKRMHFTSLADAFPENEPIAYWLLFRTFADEVWMERDLEWSQFDLTTMILLRQWNKLAKYLDPIIQTDLHREANKTLTKALDYNPLRTWQLLSSVELGKEVPRYELADFYPNLARLRDHPFVWKAIEEQLQATGRNSRESGLSFLARVIASLPEALRIVQEDFVTRQPHQADVVAWITRTIFLKEEE